MSETLPEGWYVKHSSSKPGRKYYVNSLNGKTTWDLPTQPAIKLLTLQELQNLLGKHAEGVSDRAALERRLSAPLRGQPDTLAVETLPEGWHVKQSSKGKRYYANCYYGQTTWDRPMAPAFKELTLQGLQDLNGKRAERVSDRLKLESMLFEPLQGRATSGWKMLRTKESAGRPYFVNQFNERMQWERPTSEAVTYCTIEELVAFLPAGLAAKALEHNKLAEEVTDEEAERVVRGAEAPKGGWTKRFRHWDDLSWKERFAIISGQHDLERSELEKLVLKVVEEEHDKTNPTVAKVFTAFEKYDQDGDGQISFDELHALLCDLDGRWDRETVWALFAAADCNSYGRISFAEFLDWVWGSCQGKRIFQLAFPEEAVPQVSVQSVSGGTVLGPMPGPMNVNELKSQLPRDGVTNVEATLLLGDQALCGDDEVGGLGEPSRVVLTLVLKEVQSLAARLKCCKDVFEIQALKSEMNQMAGEYLCS